MPSPVEIPDTSAAMIPAVFLASLITCAAAHADGWVGQIQLENNLDEDREYSAAIEPRIQYRADDWRTHLEYEKPFHPDSTDGKLEWEYEYYWKFDSRRFSLRHEVEYDFERNRTRAELTPRWYYRPSRDFRAGVELELDYYNSKAEDALELSNAELEPTIKWTAYRDEKSQVSIELEAPVYRLYTNETGESNVEFVAIQPIFTWDRIYDGGRALEIELELPYDTVDNELEIILNISWLWGL